MLVTREYVFSKVQKAVDTFVNSCKEDPESLDIYFEIYDGRISINQIADRFKLGLLKIFKKYDDIETEKVVKNK